MPRNVVLENQGIVDVNNSTIKPLGGGGVWTGARTEILNYGICFVSVYTDVASATDGLSIEQSVDGENWDHSDTYTVPSNGAKNYSINPFAQWYRVKYTNGAVAQSAFRLQTVHKVNAKPSSHRIQDSIVDEDDAELVKSILTAKVNGGSYINIIATADGNLRVTDAESVFAISKGDVTGALTVHKFGKNEDVGTTFEPLAIGGIYQAPQPASATTLRVKAGGSADDTAAGSGAREVTLQGLDNTGALIEETIATNGVTASNATTQSFMRLFRAFVSLSGTYASAGADSMAATIVIENGAGGTDWLTIHKPDISRAQSQVGLYTVPLGYTAYIMAYHLTTDSNKECDFLLFRRADILDAAAPYQARRTVVEHVGIQGSFESHFEGGQSFSELTDIGWMVRADATAVVTADFEIILVAN